MFRLVLILTFISITGGFLFAQNGPVNSYYGKSDSVKSVIKYSNNIREGAAKFYYPDGKLKEELTYVNGKVEGTVKTYYETGKLKEVFNVENGKRQGPTSLFDSTGNYLKDITFNNGMLVQNKNTGENTAQQTAFSGNNGNELNPIKIAELKHKTVKKPLPPSEDEKITGIDPAYYLTADVMPEPVGGMKSIMGKLVYPALAREKGIQGKVEVRAFIDQYGEVTSAEVVKGIGYGCDIAARIAVYYSKFTPGLIKGKPVKVQMIVPIEFQLKSKN